MPACPYCGNDTFINATIEKRDKGTDGIGVTWNNECASSACGKWSVHDDDTGTNTTLVDSMDKSSDTV